MCHCNNQHHIRVDLIRDLVRKAPKQHAVRSVMMRRPRLGRPLDFVETRLSSASYAAATRSSRSRYQRVAATASWRAAGRTSSRLATDRADLSKSLVRRHGCHVAALVSVDAIPDLGTPRGFAIWFDLGVVKTGKQFARKSSTYVGRKAQGLVDDSLCVHRIHHTMATASGQRGTLGPGNRGRGARCSHPRLGSSGPSDTTTPGSGLEVSPRPDFSSALRGPSCG